VTFLLTAMLASAPVDVPTEVEPPAPQWPGAAAMWAAGVAWLVWANR
jgi:hypothetical protein